MKFEFKGSIEYYTRGEVHDALALGGNIIKNCLNSFLVPPRCKNLKDGYCKYGKECNFTHGPSEITIGTRKAIRYREM